MKKIIVSVSILSLFVFSSFEEVTPLQQRIAIIVNLENPIGKMPIKVVRTYWLRAAKKRWDSTNKAIKPVDRSIRCAERDIFLSSVIELTSDQVETYFTSKQYQYGEMPPDKFATDSEVIDFVSREIGAIGYVNSTSLTPSSKVSVVLEIEK